MKRVEFPPFEPSPRSEEPWPRPQWAAPPAGELGTPLPHRLVLVDSPPARAILLDFEAHSTGLVFRSRLQLGECLPPRSWSTSAAVEDFERRLRAQHGLLDAFDLRLRLPDGTELSGATAPSSGRVAGWPEPSAPVLVASDSAGGDERYWWRAWWLWPLPSGGLLTFDALWPGVAVEAASAVISAREVAAAARKAQRLWP